MGLYSTTQGPIGIFDSGYGGLTILHEIEELLPEYDYIYLGDNARTPYGTRSYDVVYEFTLQSVKKLFEMGCHLVILGCNTASAKALKTIQQKDLPLLDPTRRVLGVIRPTVEVLGDISTKTKHIGILGTEGTIHSQSYPIEIKKLFPEMTVTGQACPMWVPLVENSEYLGPGADYFVKKYIDNILSIDPNIDTLVLACTHYPMLIEKIKKYVPENIRIIAQGEIVAKSLKHYLEVHPEMDEKCSKNGSCLFFTTESEEKFKRSAAIFLKKDVDVQHIVL